MPKYHVTNVKVMRITTTYEVEADSEDEATDKVDDNLGIVLGTYEKYIDGDFWVEEVQ